MTETATQLLPLSETERLQLNDLLARQSAGQSPAVRPGEPYQALVNLSLPRRGDPQKNTDLVPAGETVNLTKEEAAELNRRQPRPVVRPAKEARQPLPRIHPREMSGRIYAPPPPPRGSDQPRPDPPGSSHIVEREVQIPEAGEPQIGSENLSEPEAIDIPPRSQGGRTRR